MKRIYLDSNIFRYLKKGEKEIYRKLYSNLQKFDDRLLYYYSHAHLLDLEQDKTDYKFADMDFMEELVDTNYLVLPYDKEYVNVQIAKPREVFDGFEEILPFEEYFNLDTLFDEELLASNPELYAQKELMQKLLNTNLNFGIEDSLKGQPQETKDIIERLIPGYKNNFTFLEWIKKFSEMTSGLYNDKSVYKDLRRFSLDHLSLTKKYDIDIESINFNEDLKDTPVQKSFIEYIEQTLALNKNNEKQKTYNFFTTAYNILNILGIDKEPNSKARFANTMHDGLHSFYAAHCDYLVTDDKGLLLKSKVLYKLFGIETKVLSVEEFAKSISIIAGNDDKDLNSYIKFLRFELQNSLIIDNSKSFKYNREYYTFKTNNFHFGFFNHFDHIIDADDGDFYVFYKKFNNYSIFTSYKEFESVVNKAVNIFGTDKYFRGKYTENDTLLIDKGEWHGRVWELEDLKFKIEINEGTNKFCYSVFMK